MQTPSGYWLGVAAATLLLVSATLGSPTVSSASNPRSEDAPTISDAVKEWTKHRNCHEDFFARTPANFETSGYLKFYNETYSELKTQFPQEFEKLGEVRLFAQKIANSHGFKCTSQTAACEEFPTCSSVVRYNRKNYKLEEALDRTKKVMLTLDKINAISKYFKTLKSIVKQVEQTISEEAATIVERYTTQPDVSAEKKCFLVHELHRFGLAFLANLNSFGWNVATSGQIPGVPEKMKGMPNPAPIINSLFIDLPVMLHTVFEKWNEKDQHKVWEAIENPPGRGLRMDQSYLKGMCAKFGGDMPKENFHRAAQMWKDISKVFDDLHTALDRVHKMLMNGDLSREQSLLALWIGSPKVAEAIKHLADNEDEYKRNMTRGARELYMSESWASSKCYGKCRKATNLGKKFCTEDPQNRYCPDAHTGCEAKCLTTQEEGNKEEDLVGKTFLAREGLTVAGILEKSFQNYRKHGNRYLNPADIAGTGMGLDAIATGDISMIALPMCVSEWVRVTGTSDRFANFPCSCGDWTGNETQPFYAGIGLAKDDRDITTGVAHEVFERICPWNMHNMPPFTNFINQCRINMNWPQEGKSGMKGEDIIYMHRYKLGRGASEHCGTMIDETEGMDQGEASYHFCKGSTGKQIMSTEKPHIDTEGFGNWELNHKQQCKKFLPTYNPWH